MGFLKRLWGYIKTLFRVKTEAAMDPEIEIEQAISEARKRDQELRNQAAKVVAHRTQLESKIEKAADDVGESREMAKQALMKAQEAQGVCAFVDAEHALDLHYAKRLGVDVKHLLVSQPDCGEQGLEIADTLVRTNAIDLIVVD